MADGFGTVAAAADVVVLILGLDELVEVVEFGVEFGGAGDFEGEFSLEVGAVEGVPIIVGLLGGFHDFAELGAVFGEIAGVVIIAVGSGSGDAVGEPAFGIFGEDGLAGV